MPEIRLKAELAKNTRSPQSVEVSEGWEGGTHLGTRYTALSGPAGGSPRACAAQGVEQPLSLQGWVMGGTGAAGRGAEESVEGW